MESRLHSLTAEARATFWRSLAALNGTRVVIALVLLIYQSLDAPHPVSLLGELSLYKQVCMAYLALAVGFAMIASYLLSSSFVPVMSVWLLQNRHVPARRAGSRDCFAEPSRPAGSSSRVTPSRPSL